MCHKLRSFGYFKRDFLMGGTGGDTFIFTSASDTPAGIARDVIRDFNAAEDYIDLSAIQAGQTFSGGLSFGNVAGQIRYSSATGLLQGDTEGNGTANYEIKIGIGTPIAPLDLILQVRVSPLA
jgi:serralysin